MNIEISKGVETTSCIGIQVLIKGAKGKIAPRDHLIYTVLQEIYDERGWDYSGPLLSIAMPCNRVITYDKSSDVPWESVPCPCDNPNHWVIKYIEEK